MNPHAQPHRSRRLRRGVKGGARRAHGITLPSLGVDLPTFASRCPVRPLIALGNCNVLTAQALTAALRKGAA
ncbi:hypothetical protein GCM10010478_60930 [Streptomyces erythrogriseus]|uniref:Uncharacterized protein n=2 Tax=Streptomyces TaxID=1883 RepID=A0ABN3XEJ0_9ACTN